MDEKKAKADLEKAHSKIWPKDKLREVGGYGEDTTNTNNSNNTDKGEVNNQNT